MYWFNLKDNNNLNIHQIIYYILLLLIICCSYACYAPANYPRFNSDQAIHVLMSVDFELQRDFYYWGQRRLGSILPMLTFLVGKILPFHHLHLISIVQYIFLFTGFLILSAPLTNKFLKLAICAILFLPVNHYNALILIGHPYSSQLFSGSLFIFTLSYLRKYLINIKDFNIKDGLIATLLGFVTIIFFFIGIWSSEFSAVLVIIPVAFILFDKRLKNTLFQNLQNRYFISFLMLSSVFTLLNLYIFKKLKSFNKISEEAYEKVFVDSFSDLENNILFFINKLEISLLFKDMLPFENFFNWFIIILSFIIVFSYRNRIKDKLLLVKSLLVVCIISTLFLFISSWNLRAEFQPRYFTPVYLIYCFTLCLILDKGNYKPWLKTTASLLFVFFGLRHVYGSVISKNLPSPFEEYSDFRQLPKGTLIGDFWDVHQINAVALYNLHSIAYETQTVRNWYWKEIPLSEQNFYFLKRDKEVPGGFREYIVQYCYIFKNSGQTHICNGVEVMLYHKIDSLRKFTIKTHDNKYVSLNKENDMLFKSVSDSSNADIFELQNTHVGSALKAPNGKFVTANFAEDGVLFARFDHASTWEISHLIAQDKRKFNILILDKYLSSEGDKLRVNANTAGESEIFLLEDR